MHLTISCTSTLAGYQFFGTSEHYGKAHGYLPDYHYDDMNYNCTACCWFPDIQQYFGNTPITVLTNQVLPENCWLHCSKCRILVPLLGTQKQVNEKHNTALGPFTLGVKHRNIRKFVKLWWILPSNCIKFHPKLCKKNGKPECDLFNFEWNFARRKKHHNFTHAGMVERVSKACTETLWFFSPELTSWVVRTAASCKGETSQFFAMRMAPWLVSSWNRLHWHLKNKVSFFLKLTTLAS